MDAEFYELEFQTGHRSNILDAEERQKHENVPPEMTHSWYFYVQMLDERHSKKIFKKIVINLHETFNKNKRVFRSPPYRISEFGYGSFLMTIEFYMRAPSAKSNHRTRCIKKHFMYKKFEYLLQLVEPPQTSNSNVETFKIIIPSFGESISKAALSLGAHKIPEPEILKELLIQTINQSSTPKKRALTTLQFEAGEKHPPPRRTSMRTAAIQNEQKEKDDHQESKLIEVSKMGPLLSLTMQPKRKIASNVKIIPHPYPVNLLATLDSSRERENFTFPQQSYSASSSRYQEHDDLHMAGHLHVIKNTNDRIDRSDRMLLPISQTSQNISTIFHPPTNYSDITLSQMTGIINHTQRHPDMPNRQFDTNFGRLNQPQHQFHHHHHHHQNTIQPHPINLKNNDSVAHSAFWNLNSQSRFSGVNQPLLSKPTQPSLHHEYQPPSISQINNGINQQYYLRQNSSMSRDMQPILSNNDRQHNENPNIPNQQQQKQEIHQHPNLRLCKTPKFSEPLELNFLDILECRSSSNTATKSANNSSSSSSTRALTQAESTQNHQLYLPMSLNAVQPSSDFPALFNLEPFSNTNVSESTKDKILFLTTPTLATTPAASNSTATTSLINGFPYQSFEMLAAKISENNDSAVYNYLAKLIKDSLGVELDENYNLDLLSLDHSVLQHLFEIFRIPIC